jgi:hypothetical protein
VNGPAATLEDVIAAAASRSASLVPETSGYLILGVAEATQRVPLLLDLRSVLITTDGDVELQPSGEVVSPAEAGQKLRGLLGHLLSVSAGTLAALSAAANPARGGGIDALALDVEAALIPMNRAAGRRALARLARDTLRAGSRGAPRRPAPPRSPAPVVAPVEPPAPPPPSCEAISPAEPPLPESAPQALPTPPSAPTSSIPRPASPGERKLKALRGSLARTGLRGGASWVGWTSENRASERTPSKYATSPTPTADTCSSAAPTLPLFTSVELEIVESSELEAVESAEPEALESSIDPAIDIDLVEPDGMALEDLEVDAAGAQPDPSLPLWIEMAMASDASGPLAASERRGLTMRWSFEKDGSTGLLEGGAPVVGRAEILAFFEQTPSAPVELVGSPTIAMSIEPFMVEPPRVGETLPWPASYPYEQVSRRPAAGSDAPSLDHGLPDLAAEPPTLGHGLPDLAAEPPTLGHGLPKLAADPPSLDHGPPKLAADPPSAASTLTPAPLAPQPEPASAPRAGPDRADELLRRFASGPDGETANIRAAAKGLRVMAGIDLTPTAASLLPAAVHPTPAVSGPASPDDITPPATSPGPASTRAPRPSRRGFVRSAFAFAAGIAGATVVLHVDPSFPEHVVAILDHAIPAADPPSPAGSPPPAPPAAEGTQPPAGAEEAPEPASP